MKLAQGNHKKSQKTTRKKEKSAKRINLQTKYIHKVDEFKT